ncbi:MAG: tRNA (N6-isopentenyl adenosine(37)-C2)-methylthiotransferase MiaB [Desulfobacterales bacterium]|nr:tRNA (N6-isopentenyl adenosine(37)-C2)-methylthiotransferase MiaB [Desulfobacterales bacterium]
MEQKRLHIVTMGCQMNVYDSEQMERLLAPMNYRPSADAEKADLVLLNTCSIREKAEHKVYSFLGRLARVKRSNPDLIIGVGGCVAQQEGYRLLERAPHVDIVFGTFALRRLPALVRQVTEQRRQLVDVGGMGPEELSYIKPWGPQGERATAFVTIMTGCDNFCTYCVVPYVRGREVSRKPEIVLEEIQHLVQNGIREVTLLGQNVNAYGLKNGHGCDFPALLAAVNNIEGLKRIRFTTSHPKDLSDKLISAFARLDKLAPHIHLPVQSGSNRILRRMNRGYTRDKYLGRVEKLRKARPDIAITSDIIVGFPGEKTIDFEDTLNLVESVAFDNLYTFKYSDRPNAPASRFSNKVPEDINNERFVMLVELQTKITLEKDRSLLGTIQEVLVEGLSKKNDDQVTGRTPCNKIVNFSDSSTRVGKLVPVKVVEAFSHSLLGDPVKWRRQYSGKKGGILHAV